MGRKAFDSSKRRQSLGRKKIGRKRGWLGYLAAGAEADLSSCEITLRIGASNERVAAQNQPRWQKVYADDGRFPRAEAGETESN